MKKGFFSLKGPIDLSLQSCFKDEEFFLWLLFKTEHFCFQFVLMWDNGVIHTISALYTKVYRLTFPLDGAGLKRFFQNGRRQTTILIGRCLMTSLDANYSAKLTHQQPLWNWACFEFFTNQFILKKILLNWIQIWCKKQKFLFSNSLQLLLKPIF